MSEIKIELNRLAVGFWCETENYHSLNKWIDLVSAESSDFHPFFWNLLEYNSYENTTSLLLKMANDINGFKIESWESEEYAQIELIKAIKLLLDDKMVVSKFCKLISLLDGNYNIDLAGVPHPKNSNSTEDWWLGNLWNCCDWCDSDWTIANSPELIEEAKLILSKLTINEKN